jgi:hypothetical protein
MPSENLVQKIENAFDFGAVLSTKTEIVDEVRGLLVHYEYTERLLTQIRQMCDADGSNPTVQAIRRLIDG